MRKIVTIVFDIIGILIVVVIIAGVIFRHEWKSLSTLTKKSNGVYTMEYDGDYGFDEFLKTGAKNDKDIETFVTKRLLHGIPIKFNVTEAGCTAFVSKNKKGEVIFGRNFDFTYAPFVQVITHPDNGYASISTVNLSFARYDKNNLPSSAFDKDSFLMLSAPYLPFDGMNEKGVCMALLAVPKAQMKTNHDKVTLNTTTSIRLVLDKAATVDEAVDLLKQYNIYFSGDIDCHFLIADASGKSVIVEYYDGGLKIVKPDADYQIASNFIAYKGVNIGEGYTEFERYEKVKAVLEKNGNAVSMQQCEELLNDVGCYNGKTDKLQWSVVYNLTGKKGKIWPHRKIENYWWFAL